jgi:tRNA pseudouridine55 synthase
MAHTLEDLAEDFRLLPIADAARAAFPAYDLDEARATDVRYGRALDLDLAGLTAVFAPDGQFLALYEPRDGVARAAAVFVEAPSR